MLKKGKACFGFWSNFFFNAQRFDGNKKLYPILYTYCGKSESEFDSKNGSYFNKQMFFDYQHHLLSSQ